jgi:putative PIN family toxin of toxin-antitoxin system
VSAPARLVLDTNVVIDWLVFDDPFMAPLRDGVPEGRLQILTHPPAIDELKRVLGYKSLKLDAARQSSIFDRYVAQTVMAELPLSFSVKNLMTPGGFPRCRDRDDQPFLALAFHSKCDALVSRDDAVYGLKNRAAKFGVTIWNVREMIAALNSSDAAWQLK